MFLVPFWREEMTICNPFFNDFNFCSSKLSYEADLIKSLIQFDEFMSYFFQKL